MDKPYVWTMNENDYVLHYTFEEAVNYYDNLTGIYEECEDDNTGKVQDISNFTVWIDGDANNKMTAKKAMEIGELSVPCLLSSEI